MRPPFLLPAESPGRVLLPLFGHRVTAGFPSPADDYVEDRLDLNELLVQRQEATYFLRVKGDSMVGAGSIPATSLSSTAPSTPRMATWWWQR